LIVTAGLDAEAQAEISRIRRGSPVRVVGPNALGVINPALNLNATFAPSMPRAGRVTFLSQSGTLGAAVLSKSASQNVGIRAFLSVGDMVDVGWGELLTYFGADSKTRCIIVYMEALGDARAFISAARETSLDKPIIIIKTGRTAEGVSAIGRQAVGVDAVLDAAFRRCGVLRVDSVVDAFYFAQVLDKQPLPHGKKLTVITNARGPGVLAADALTETGGTLSSLFPKDITALEDVLPRYWGRSNPIVVGSDADAERYAAAFDIVLRRMTTDGVLVILTPQAMSQPLETAKRLTPFAGIGKTVLACWMGGDEVEEAVEALNEGGIPTFAYPDTAARIFDYLWRYIDRLTALYETPLPAMEAVAHIGAERLAEDIFAEARADRRPELWPSETADVLRAYGLTTSVDDVPPFPDDESVYRFRLVNTIDTLFGPVIALRLSGRIAHREGVGLPPLNSTLAEMLIEAAGLARALPAPVSEALNGVVVRFSQLVADHPSLRELTSEVTITDEGEAVITKAHTHLYETEGERPRLAIRPYPTEYASTETLKDGMEVILRPIRPEDEPYLADFQRILSERSVQMRYFSAVELYRRTSHEWLSRQSFIDYEREIRLAAAPADDPERIVATGQLIKVGSGEMEYAIMVSDEMQGKGLGTRMLTRLVEIGRQEGATAIIAYILYTNQAMLAVSRKLGFSIRRTEDPTIAQAHLPLG
jgi:RimJ/RimL family protein N-acetyltransferase